METLKTSNGSIPIRVVPRALRLSVRSVPVENSAFLFVLLTRKFVAGWTEFFTVPARARKTPDVRGLMQPLMNADQRR